MLRVFRSRRVVTPEGLMPADVIVTAGRITSVDEYGTCSRSVEDLGELVLMPGLVDTHVHINEPGRTEWEGFACATRAAAAGGITTLFDMPLNSTPVTTTVAAFELKRQAAKGKCRVDVGFYGGLVPDNLTGDALTPLIDEGVFALKAFLCDSGLDEFPPVKVDEIRGVASLLAESSIPLLVHAEIADCRPLSHPTPHYADYLASRPPSFELRAIEELIQLSRDTRCAVHIVHLSTAEALPMLRSARAEGLPITVESCPHYLYFCAEEVPRGDTRFKCAPPIRDALNRELLWQGLESGSIDLIATDHSPCPPARKALSSGDFAASWGGISSLQLSLPVTWTAARDRGHGVEKLVDWMCTGPARLVGLGSERGSIAPGLLADMVAWSPEESFTVEGARLEHRHSLTPYEGRTLFGVVHRTFRRGRVVFRSGVPDGAFPEGTFPVLLHSTESPARDRGSRTHPDPSAPGSLNRLPREDAVRCLKRCCGSSAWANSVADRLPFRDRVHLLALAEQCFDRLTEKDWLEAFAAHPRIGDLAALRRRFGEASQEGAEQSATASASENVLSALAEGNQLYEERNGFVFLVSSTGKSAEEMLDILGRRLESDRERELRVAAGEQRKITRLRLERLMELRSVRERKSSEKRT